MTETTPFAPLHNFSADRNCFACGRENPHGLQMQFATDGHLVVSDLAIPAHLCGWDHLSHGGVITTILDETMSWTAIHLLRRIILTRSIQVDFFKTVPTDQAIRAQGKVAKRVSERQAVMEAEIVFNGDICARSAGTFALFTPRTMRRMNIVAPHIIDDFERYFQTEG